MNERHSDFLPLEISDISNYNQADSRPGENPGIVEPPPTIRKKKTVNPDIATDPTGVASVPENIGSTPKTNGGNFDTLAESSETTVWRAKNAEQAKQDKIALEERARLYQPHVEADYKSVEFLDHESARKLTYARELHDYLDKKITTLESDLHQAKAIKDPEVNHNLSRSIAIAIANFETKLTNAKEILQLLKLGRQLNKETDPAEILKLKQTIADLALPLNLREITAVTQKDQSKLTNRTLALNPNEVTAISSKMPKELTKEEREKEKAEEKIEKSFKLEIKKEIIEKDLERIKEELYRLYEPDALEKLAVSEKTSLLDKQTKLKEKKFQLMSLIRDHENDQKRIKAELLAISQGTTTLKPIKQIFPPEEPEEIDPADDHGLPPTEEIPVKPGTKPGNGKVLQMHAANEIAQLPTMEYISKPDHQQSPPRVSELPKPNVHPESDVSSIPIKPKSRWRRVWEAISNQKAA